MSIKGLPAAVVSRLALQAEAEGISVQEWMRRSLTRTSELLTPRELEALVARREPVSEEAFHETMSRVSTRRATATAAARRSARSDVRHGGS